MAAGTRKRTAAALFGYDDGTAVAEYGVGLGWNGDGMGMPSAPAAPVQGAPFTLPGGFAISRDFWRSSDAGLLLFGALLIYFDVRLVNRRRS